MSDRSQRSQRPDHPNPDDNPFDPEWTPDPEQREDPNWFKDIGPEDQDPEVTAERIREEFDRLDEDDFVSDPVGPADMPDWTDVDSDDMPGAYDEAWYEEELGMHAITILPDDDDDDDLTDTEEYAETPSDDRPNR